MYGRERNNFCSADMPCGGGRGFLLAAHRAEDQAGKNTQGRIIDCWFAGNFGCGKKYRGIAVAATQFSNSDWSSSAQMDSS